jgi:hypothetical protein
VVVAGIIRLAGVVEQHAPLRAPGLTRALGVLLLLAGVVAMHAAVFAVAPAQAQHAGQVQHVGQVQHGMQDQHAAMGEAHSIMAMPADAEHSNTAGADCGAGGCEGHGAMHGCVFILTALALALMLVLLYWLPVDRPGTGGSRPRHGRRQRERAPPWTVLSLAELSILRI